MRDIVNHARDALLIKMKMGKIVDTVGDDKKKMRQRLAVINSQHNGADARQKRQCESYWTVAFHLSGRNDRFIRSKEFSRLCCV